MNVNKVYCLFEQSGTFKNIFLAQGINAIDIDIENPVSHYLIHTLGKYTIAHRRNKYGDKLQKRTMYYCYNCTIDESKMKLYDNSVTGNNVQRKLKGINRSLISLEYAANLINAIVI